MGLEKLLDLLDKIGENFGFVALVAVLYSIFSHLQARFVVKKMENFYLKEVDRIAKERNKLQDFILENKRLSTRIPDEREEQ